MYFAAEREYLGTLGFLGSHGSEPFGTFEDYLRDVGVGFNVIDYGRLAPQTFYCGERRTGARHTSVTLDGGQKRGLRRATAMGYSARMYIQPSSAPIA